MQVTEFRKGSLRVLVTDCTEAGAKKSYPFEVTEYSLWGDLLTVTDHALGSLAAAF
jgi:hypothetical protein